LPSSPSVSVKPNRLLKNLEIFPTIAISSRSRDEDARQ
jgi:hypothetical protein